MIHEFGLLDKQLSLPASRRAQVLQKQTCLEILFLTLNCAWHQYHELLKKCRQSCALQPVHAFRTAIRRLTACLDLIEKITDQIEVCSLRTHFKNQLNLLGRLRDLQVQERTLKGDSQATTLEPFRKSLRKKRKSEQELARKRLRKVSIKTLGAQLLGINECIIRFASQVHRNENDPEILTQYLNQRYQRLKFCTQKTKTFKPSMLHGVRIQFKEYRYAWEILEPILSMPSSIKKEMKLFQTLLGKIQDSTVLIRSLDKYKSGYDKGNQKYMFQIYQHAQEIKRDELIKQFHGKKNEFLLKVQPHFEGVEKQTRH